MPAREHPAADQRGGARGHDRDDHVLPRADDPLRDHLPVDDRDLDPRTCAATSPNSRWTTRIISGIGFPPNVGSTGRHQRPRRALLGGLRRVPRRSLRAGAGRRVRPRPRGRHRAAERARPRRRAPRRAAGPRRRGHAGTPRPTSCARACRRSRPSTAATSRSRRSRASSTRTSSSCARWPTPRWRSTAR